MDNFNFYMPNKIFFGKGKLENLYREILNYSNDVLLLCGEKSLKDNNYYFQIINEFDANNINYTVETITDEPSVDLIDSIVKKYKEENVSLIVGVGGGSVIDSAKAVSAMLKNDGSVMEYLDFIGDKKPNGKKVPFIAIPTTAGTGSETSTNAVIKSNSNDEPFKRSIRHINYAPNIAIIDPMLMLSCPKNIIKQAGINAFCQLLEGYISIDSNPITDTLAEEGLEKITRSFLNAYNDNNYEAMSDLSYAAMLSGIVMTNAGLTSIHSFSSAISGLYTNIPYGNICSAIMINATLTNIQKIKDFDPHNPAAFKYGKLGAMMAGIDYSPDKHEVFFRAVAETLEEWQSLFEFPTLSAFGITGDDFWKILEHTNLRNNPVELTEAEMESILEKSL